MKTHEELILGDSLQIILAEDKKRTPYISEYQFGREVVDLLENPFTKESLQRYELYVGELTKPLNVVANDDVNNVLFTVPAFVQTPTTTIPRGNAITPESFLKTLQRDTDLGGRNVNEKILQFMTKVTKVPDYQEAVIKPIQGILARYDRTMAFVGAGETQTAETKPVEPARNSTFSDEYDD